MAVVLNIASEFNNKGIKQATQQFQNLQDAGKRAGSALKSAILPATAAVAALGAVLVTAVKSAVQDEVAQQELARVLQKTTKATDVQIKAVEEWITLQGKVLGITDDELRPAYAGLLRATNSVTKAQKLSAIAFDLATAKSLPLATVTKALEKAYGGNLTALSKLAPEYRDMIKNGASFEEVMKKVAEATGGAAAGAANTTAGKMQRLKVRFDELKETVGALLLPVLEKLLDIIMEKIIPAFESLVGFVSNFNDTVKKDGAAKAIGEVFDNVGTYLKDEALPFIGKTLAAIGKAFVDWIAPNIKPMLKELGKFIVAAGKWIVETGLPAFFKKMKELGQALVDWIEPNIEPMLKELGKFIKAIVVWIATEGLPTLLKGVGELALALSKWSFEITPEVIRGLNTMAKEIIKIIPEILKKLLPEFAKIGNALGKAMGNGIIDRLNDSLDKIGKIGLGPVGNKLFPGGFDIPNIPRLAEGGIVTGPTLAMIGEGNGPEAVIPLSKMGGMGGGVNITIQTGVGDPVAIGKAVSDALNAYNRRTGKMAA